jgi:hypothetical protein
MEKYIEKHPEVPENVMADLREQLGLARDDEEQDLEILCLDPSEFLERWMRWNGMVGWTEDIIDAIAMAYGIDLRSYPLERTVERKVVEW